MRKIRLLLAALLCALAALPAAAQEDTTRFDHFFDRYKEYREVLRDSAFYQAPTETRVVRDTVFDPMRVVTNKFGKNWFFFATAGAHFFRGDYSGDGGFGGTISPDFGVGVGKWFTPGIGVKLEWIRGDSRGYTEYLTGHYGHGDVMLQPDGTPYRKMKTAWWDISGSVIFNLTRLFFGYEGYGSPKRMNQFLFNAGIGGVHHMGFGKEAGSDNEWSGHAELQYSRFFNRKKNFSLDAKFRALFYQTNFDLEYGQANHAANKWDCNLGLDIGFTYYLGSRRSNGWKHGAEQFYTRDYREKKVLIVRERDNKFKHKVLTFYVFYPNNYSGRNDAPQIKGATVNAIDYLACGINTQKQYANNGAVAEALTGGKPLQALKFKDLPTEPANQKLRLDFVPRGYEMIDAPLSLPLTTEAMTAFRARAGYYYAPIFDGEHTWHYRIDDATLGQRLLLDDNYKESQSFRLNAHAGLGLVAAHKAVEKGDQLVAFADVYAAVTSREGFVAQCADSTATDLVRDVLQNGMITMIQTEGLATSQDNFYGVDAERVGHDRNEALSHNRAATVIAWLKQNPRLADVASHIYLVNSLDGDIGTVRDTSTRGLNAKLNRCVRVRIHYLGR